MTKTQAKLKKISRTNITCLQHFALCNLANHKKFITIWADKSMGIVIMLQDASIKQCINEHLGNTQVYENITGKHEAKIEELNSKFDNFISNNKKVLGHQTITFFNCNHKIYGDNIACFRATAKVHKHPMKLRSIFAKVGTSIKSVSKWLDHQLQKLMTHLPWCVKDSYSFRHEVIKPHLPPNARVVTFDTQSMYSNI